MLKILIADDERLTRLNLIEIIKDILKDDYEIDQAKDGIELCTKCNNNNYDIAFVDVNMPKLNGLDAIRKITSNKTETAWYVLSGYAEFEYARDALTLGVREYLLKPVDEKDIHRVILKTKKEKEESSTTLSEKEELINKVNEKRNNKKTLAEEIYDYVSQNYTKNISISDVAELFEITPSYVSRVFHNATGMKYIDFITDLRMKKAAELLSNSNLSVSKIANEVGYISESHFTKLFKKHFGISPSEFGR